MRFRPQATGERVRPARHRTLGGKSETSTKTMHPEGKGGCTGHRVEHRPVQAGMHAGMTQQPGCTHTSTAAAAHYYTAAAVRNKGLGFRVNRAAALLGGATRALVRTSTHTRQHMVLVYPPTHTPPQHSVRGAHGNIWSWCTTPHTPAYVGHTATYGAGVPPTHTASTLRTWGTVAHSNTLCVPPLLAEKVGQP